MLQAKVFFRWVVTCFAIWFLTWKDFGQRSQLIALGALLWTLFKCLIKVVRYVKTLSQRLQVWVSHRLFPEFPFLTSCKIELPCRVRLLPILLSFSIFFSVLLLSVKCSKSTIGSVRLLKNSELLPIVLKLEKTYIFAFLLRLSSELNTKSSVHVWNSSGSIFIFVISALQVAISLVKFLLYASNS